MGDVSDHRARGRFASRGLRRATFILPATGERSTRSFTLRDHSSRDVIPDDGNNESSPLLSRRLSPHSQNAQLSRVQAGVSWARTKARSAYQFATSKTGLNILKCSIAYLLGSMATFIPAIRKELGANQNSKHMVATVTVWFHPARTMGSMLEATVLACLALCYSGFISFTSMAIAMFFADKDLLVVGHAIDLIVFVGGGLGFIAWVKQRLNHPLVNVAAALASLGCITILIKEGDVQAGEFSDDRVLQVLAMVMLGIITSSLVNLLVLPVTARKALARDLEKTTDTLGEMLISITRAFLSGRECDMKDEAYESLTKSHTAAIGSMKKNLGEAKREYFVLGMERLWDVEARLVECLLGLSQDIGGLRSAAFTQFAIINDDSDTDDDCLHSSATANASNSVSKGLGVIAEFPEDDSDPLHESATSTSTSNQAEFYSPRGERGHYESLESSVGMLSSTADMFIAFLHQLGPPTKSLVYTLKQILDELPFESVEVARGGWQDCFREQARTVAVNQNFHSSLKQAVELYRQSRREALETLYKNRGIHALRSPQLNHDRPSLVRRGSGATTPREQLVADVEEVSACCGHFSFSLLDFAEDVLTYLALLEELKQQMENPTRSWKFLVPHRLSNQPRSTRSGHLARTGTFQEQDTESEIAQEIPDIIRKIDDFADPEKLRQQRPWTYPLYKIERVFHRDDVKFALKVGIGAVLFATPAFIPETRPFFVRWRGEWGLVSYMAICSMTVGASNTTGLARIIGTLIGAAVAVVAWVTSNSEGVANSVMLAIWGWLVSLCCFYLMLAKNNGPMARFILLTYNLGALYSYTLSVHDPNDEDDVGGIDPAIWDIMIHRVVAVITGVAWGIFITRFIWPISARKKLKNGLCILWLRMGLIWKRDPLALLLLGEPTSRYMDIREEASLQAFLTSLDGLRMAAASEFELRGPFPNEQIKRMIEQTGRMLNSFHAMNVVISKNLQWTAGEALVLRATRPERFELSGRISHLFSVLASSIKLEYPLSDVLPSIEHTRDRLLARIAEFRRIGEGRETVTEQDYELLYAYVLVTGQLSQEIQAVSTEIESLYGILDEDNLKLD